LFILGKQPVGISCQDRLMSTSYRYEINTGKPDLNSLRVQQAAQVNIINANEIYCFFFLNLE
jgi:hypothetical protein